MHMYLVDTVSFSKISFQCSFVFNSTQYFIAIMSGSYMYLSKSPEKFVILLKRKRKKIATTTIVRCTSIFSSFLLNYFILFCSIVIYFDCIVLIYLKTLITPHNHLKSIDGIYTCIKYSYSASHMPALLKSVCIIMPIFNLYITH